MGCSPWGCKESDSTEGLSLTSLHSRPPTGYSNAVKKITKVLEGLSPIGSFDSVLNMAVWKL